MSETIGLGFITVEDAKALMSSGDGGTLGLPITKAFHQLVVSALYTVHVPWGRSSELLGFNVSLVCKSYDAYGEEPYLAIVTEPVFRQ